LSFRTWRLNWKIGLDLDVWDVVDRGSVEVTDRSIIWEARSMVSVDALLDEHEVAIRAQVEELREEAARVAVALALAEQELKHVSITRATLAAVLSGRGQWVEWGQQAGDPGTQGPAGSVGGSAMVPAYGPDLAEAHLPDEYRRVYLAVRGAAGGARAKELAGALGLEPVPAKVEGLRHKVKRLASCGWICESAPGVFAAVG
jgi:hypothetical protein